MFDENFERIAWRKFPEGSVKFCRDKFEGYLTIINLSEFLIYYLGNYRQVILKLLKMLAFVRIFDHNFRASEPKILKLMKEVGDLIRNILEQNLKPLRFF